jgi:cephalosporin-C deacetylase
MRNALLLASLLLFFHFSRAQSIDLSGNWKFHKGDSMVWASVKTIDSAWQNLKVGETWESGLKEAYDGIGWYKKTIIIPVALKKEASLYGELVLNLGKIDDADETYFNGIKVGGLGNFVSKQTAWDVDRKYIIPVALIDWDKPNTISVRVNDWGGGGGLYGGEYRLEPTTWREKLVTEVKNTNSTNAYSEKDTVNIGVIMKNQSLEKLTFTVSCEVSTFTGLYINQKRQSFTIGSKKELRLKDFSFSGLMKGFYIAKISITSKGISKEEKIGFAVAPEKCESKETLPIKFNEFWEQSLAELKEVKPDYKLILQPKLTTEKLDVYLVEMHSLGNILIRGWLTMPKNKRRLAAVLHLQGYSTVMSPFAFAEDEFANFYLNIRGHGNSIDNFNPGFHGFLYSGINDQSRFVYRGAYMDCIRAVDFLCSRVEIDSSKIGVEGASQGGALSIALSALDRRIKACAADVPFLSDFRNYFTIAQFPAAFYKEYCTNTGRTMEQVYQVLDYFDIKNLSSRIDCPIMMGVGLFDDVCPAATNFAAYNNLGSKLKSFQLYPQSGHSLPSMQQEKKIGFMRKYLK